MDINKNSLKYFNKEGIELIYDKIKVGFEETIVELEESGLDDVELKESFQITLKELESGHLNKRHAILVVLKDLELTEYQDYFWNDGWEGTFGLDKF